MSLVGASARSRGRHVSRLMHAICAGGPGAALELLRRDTAELDRKGPDGLTPLMAAAGRGQLAVVDALIQAGADIHARDDRAGASALHKACQGGSVAVAAALLKAGAGVNERVTATGHSPLVEAAWFAWPDVVGLLLEHDAILDLPTHYGFTLEQHLEYAIRVNPNPEPFRDIAARVARRREQDAAKKQAATLANAVLAGDETRVAALLAAGADLEARLPATGSFDDQHTALLLAAREGRAQMVGALVVAGADVNAVEPTFGAVPLHKATYNGHTEITRILAAAPGIDLDFRGYTNGYTPLLDALWHGFAECAHVLLDAGADWRLVGHDGLTSVQLAEQRLGAQHALTQRLRELEGLGARALEPQPA